MNVSGKTSSLTLSRAACSIRATVFRIVAALSMNTGAAWAAATLRLVCFAVIAFRTGPKIGTTAMQRVEMSHNKDEC